MRAWLQEPKPIPKERLKSYASREASSPNLGSFEGGTSAPGIWIGIAVICLVVLAVYYLIIEPQQFRR
ncbi:MAG TPA: hypothetical protein VGK61_01775 [Planctomycetota bacterium]|jgi:hypothetical protein